MFYYDSIGVILFALRKAGGPLFDVLILIIEIIITPSKKSSLENQETITELTYCHGLANRPTAKLVWFPIDVHAIFLINLNIEDSF